MSSPRILSFLAVVVLLALLLLYVREFAVLSNTIGVGGLVAGSMGVAAALAGGAVWRWRERFKPWDRHFPEVVLIVVFSVLFAPLLGSCSTGVGGRRSFNRLCLWPKRPTSRRATGF